MVSVSIKGRLPSIPEYFKELVDMNINLDETPKICCPFHKEDTPSFSYSKDKKVWRCFGSCKAGGDVVEMHRINYELGSREEALKSLQIIYGVSSKPMLRKVDLEAEVDDNKVEMEALYQRLCRLATTVDRWLDLDYVMSKYPLEVSDLQSVLDKWLGVSDSNEDLDIPSFEEYEFDTEYSSEQDIYE